MKNIASGVLRKRPGHFLLIYEKSSQKKRAAAEVAALIPQPTTENWLRFQATIKNQQLGFKPSVFRRSRGPRARHDARHPLRVRRARDDHHHRHPDVLPGHRDLRGPHHADDLRRPDAELLHG